MGTVKSEGGDLTDSNDYWDKYVRGLPLPKPKTTFATKKFFDYMVGSGINVSHRNGELTLSPLTDADILKRSNGELSNAKTTYGKETKAEKGGLFDVAVTGGPDGRKWSHYRLPEPIVNPVMEDPVKSMLGLKQSEFNDITSGKLGVKRLGKGHYNLIDTDSEQIVRNLKLNAASQFLTKSASDIEDYKVGGHAFREMLSDINPDEEIAILKDKIHEVKSASKKDEIIKRMKYLKGMSKQGFDNPADASLLHHLPILPPVMRPISISDRQTSYADVNGLYKDFYTVKKGVEGLLEQGNPAFLPDLQLARAGTYEAAKAIMAGGDPINYSNKQKGLKGLMTQIGGGGLGPKKGLFQSKLLTKKQDVSGRGTIYAAPDVGFNQAKFPREQLYTLYEPHIKRDLAQKGYNAADAKAAHATLFTDKKHNAALASFNKMVSTVPIIMNRAPTLMKTNILAFDAVPSDDKTIGVNPLHLPGFAGDYDGDAHSVFAPISPEAIHEANTRLKPVHHLNDAKFDTGRPMYKPQHEAILGSMYMTQHDGGDVVEFTSEADALAALKAGKIKESTPIRIVSK